MKVIIGKKLNMTQKFSETGVTPVTVVQAGPCTITQVKAAKDGYKAIQIGFQASKKHATKPHMGHLKSLSNFKYLREFRMEDEAKRGQVFSVAMFKPGDSVQVTASAKGKGFQGVVKRHHFGGSPKTHGHKDQLRMPGSIGPTEPKHVFRGTRMAGRMGGQRVTVKNLKIVEVDEAKNLLYISGAIPGARNGILLISGAGDMVFVDPAQVTAPSIVQEQPVEAEKHSTPDTGAIEPQKTETVVEKPKE